MKSLLYLLVFVFACFSVYGQWVQFGPDIECQAHNEVLGVSVSFNGVGTMMVAGASANNNVGTQAGTTRVFQFNGNEWLQVGNDIDGVAADDNSGHSVSMNALGNVIAIGAPWNQSSGLFASGHVRVFEWTGTAWSQVGNDIFGEGMGDQNGSSVSLNAAGNRIAVGAHGNDDSTTVGGQVRVFERSGNVWVQLGADIFSNSGSASGWSVSLNASGDRVAIGAPYSTGGGHVRIFSWSGTSWNQVGSNIQGTEINEYSGWSVDLNGVGDRVIIGAWGNSLFGNHSGAARVYRWNGTDWSSMGDPFHGIQPDERLGHDVTMDYWGNRIGISSYLFDDTLVDQGRVQLFEWFNDSWIPLGLELLGPEEGSGFGLGLGLSSSGDFLAVGIPSSDDSISLNCGRVVSYEHVFQYNYALGRIAWDVNGNGLVDSIEPGFVHGIIDINGPITRGLSLSSKGNYVALVDTGTYITEFSAHNSNYFNVVSGPHTTTFDTVGMQEVKDFLVEFVSGNPDVSISLFPLHPARVGFEVTFRLIVQNVGTDTVSGGVVFRFSNDLSFLSAFPNASQQFADSLFWSFNSLSPLSELTYDIRMRVSTSTNIGQNLNLTASVSSSMGDVNTNNNIAAANLIVTASFDPNDKWVSYSVFDSTLMPDSTYLTYRIRFQNTGTDTAFTVLIRDSLDSLLDWSTLQLIHTSHPDWQVIRYADNHLEWKFENILLPDSNVNEPESHGYVLYRIRPKSTFGPSDTISNKASIYFDFNAPVVTNTAITTWKQPGVYVPENQLLDQGLLIIPNPAKDQITLSIPDVKIEAVRIWTIEGTLVHEQSSNHKTLQLSTSQWANGIYLVEINGEHGVYREKLVVQR